VLGAIVIASVLSLVDIPELRRYVDQRRTDFALALVALLGVITTSVLTGLVIAAGVSVVLLLYRASQPALTTLGRIPGSREGYGDISRNAGALPEAGVLTLRLDTPPYYFNASEVETRVLAMVEAADPRPTTVVIDIGATIELDVTTADMLLELLRALRDLGVSISLAQVKGQVRDRMRRVGLMDALGQDHVFLSVLLAVDAAMQAGAETAVPAVPETTADTAILQEPIGPAVPATPNEPRGLTGLPHQTSRRGLTGRPGLTGHRTLPKRPADDRR